MFVFCNPCAHAELHQQKGARKLCSATLIEADRSKEVIKIYRIIGQKIEQM